jgi:hypothetical protein
VGFSQDKTPVALQMNTPEADKTIMAEKAARKRLQMQPPAPHSVPTDELDIVLMQPSCSRLKWRIACVPRKRE